MKYTDKQLADQNKQLKQICKNKFRVDVDKIADAAGYDEDVDVPNVHVYDLLSSKIKKNEYIWSVHFDSFGLISPGATYFFVDTTFENILKRLEKARNRRIIKKQPTIEKLEQVAADIKQHIPVAVFAVPTEKRELLVCVNPRDKDKATVNSVEDIKIVYLFSSHRHHTQTEENLRRVWEHIKLTEDFDD